MRSISRSSKLCLASPLFPVMPFQIAGQAGNDERVPCTSFSPVMPDLLLRHARLRSGISLFPSVMPDPDRASQIAGQAGNDDMVPCTSFSSVMPDLLLRHARPSPPSCPTFSSVMPDPIGHLTFPHQIAGQEIAGQAGNDDREPAMTKGCQAMTIWCYAMTVWYKILHIY